jgi:heat shock protein HslJ
MNVNQVPVSDTTITLAFGAQGDLSGNASCNTYNGSYTVNGNLFSVGPLATTRKSCGEDVDGQEKTYLTALRSAATFEISGNQLIIYDAGRQEVLRFNAAG